MDGLVDAVWAVLGDLPSYRSHLRDTDVPDNAGHVIQVFRRLHSMDGS